MAQANGQDIIKTLEDFFKKAPALPENIREVLVKIAPWLALIFGILGILGGLAAAGLSPVAAMAGVSTGLNVMISAVLTIVSSVLMLMAYPKLNKRLLSGWNLLFYSEAVSFVAALVGGPSAIIGAVIGALIGFYLLFQIKSYYK